MSSLKQLQDLIHEKYGIEPSALGIHDSMRAKGIDSLALVEFLFVVEDRLSVTLPDRESNVDTLAELATLVDKVRASQAA